MKSYRQFCPMARAAEILTERWTPVIVRNLIAGCETFTEILDGAPGISRTVLTERLRSLERRGIVERIPSSTGNGRGYRLTRIGRDLEPVLNAMGTWGARWLELDPEHLNPYVVLWDMSRLIDRAELPARRVTIRFAITDRERRNRFWLVLGPTGAEVCDRHPGYDEDLQVTTDSATLAHWHLGWLPLDRALRERTITIQGPRGLVQTFASRWQALSVFAHVPRGGFEDQVPSPTPTA